MSNFRGAVQGRGFDATSLEQASASALTASGSLYRTTQ